MNHQRHDGGLPVHPVEAAEASSLRLQSAMRSRCWAALGLLENDLQRRARRRHRGRRKARKRQTAGRYASGTAITSLEEATTRPPRQRLAKVPMTISYFVEHARCSAAPAPVGPRRRCRGASSTKVRAPFGRASLRCPQPGDIALHAEHAFGDDHDGFGRRRVLQASAPGGFHVVGGGKRTVLRRRTQRAFHQAGLESCGRTTARRPSRPAAKSAA